MLSKYWLNEWINEYVLGMVLNVRYIKENIMVIVFIDK